MKKQKPVKQNFKTFLFITYFINCLEPNNYKGKNMLKDK